MERNVEKQQTLKDFKSYFITWVEDWKVFFKLFFELNIYILHIISHAENKGRRNKPTHTIMVGLKIGTNFLNDFVAMNTKTLKLGMYFDPVILLLKIFYEKLDNARSIQKDFAKPDTNS